MASMSVYSRCYAKCVLGTKTFILSPPRTMGDCLRLPLSSAIINNNNKAYKPNKVTEVLPATNKAIPGRTMCAKYKIKTKAINIIILSRGLIQLSG